MNWIKGIFSQFDARDLFVFGGLGLLGYGVWLRCQWLSFVVVGFLLMALGLGWLFRRPV